MISVFMFHDKSFHKLSWLGHRDFKHVELAILKDNLWLFYTIAKNGLGVSLRELGGIKDFIHTMSHLPSMTHMIAVGVSPVCINNLHITKSCNEMAKYLSGVDIPFTLTPGSLYKKLLKYSGKKNYIILEHWNKNEEMQNK